MSVKKLVMLVLTVVLVIGATLAGGCAGSETIAPTRETPAQIIEDITPEEAFQMIQNNQNNPDFVIIDVRTPEEFADGYIENAVNIDYYSETFRDELDTLDKNQTYLIYCRSGGRSGNSLEIMAELNFRQVFNVLGGIIAWNAEGLPTTE